MLSVIMSGLNVAQKDLQVASNNVANANTVGFKRSSATFQDVFSNDPSANPKTAVGSGAITSMISRNTSQGAMTTTDKVTDLAIAGRGYFTLASTDPETGARNVVYTRAGNFSVNVKGEVVDSSDNQLQVFPYDEQSGKVNTSAQVVGATILSEKDAGTMRITLDKLATIGSKLNVTMPDGTVVPRTISTDDFKAGYTTIKYDSVSATNASNVSVEYDDPVVQLSFVPTDSNKLPAEGDVLTYDQPAIGSQAAITKSVTLTSADVANGYVRVRIPRDSGLVGYNATDVQNMKTSVTITPPAAGSTPIPATVTSAVTQVFLTTEYKGTYLQGIGIDSKGMIQATYGDGTKVNVGAVALASFRNDAALKPIGNTKFIASDASGGAILTRAGAPFAGDILSGTLEQANVDITQELMTMLKAQQLYNGNARMLQTAVEVGNRVTDKI